MKKLLLAFLLISAFSAKAQNIQDTGTLRSYINSYISDNTNRLITPVRLRTVLNGITNLAKPFAIDSVYFNSDTLYLTRNKVVTMKVALRSSFYDSTLMSSTKRLKDSAAAIRSALSGASFYDSVLMSSTKRVKDTATAIRATISSTVVKYSDTANQTLPYLRKFDTTTMLAPYLRNNLGVKYSDSTAKYVTPTQLASSTSGFVVAIASSTGNYTITTPNFIILSDLTGQANRNVVLPTNVSGKQLVLKNVNTNASTFSWAPTNGTIKDFVGATILTLTNATVYYLVGDGTNWNVIN